MYVLQSLILLPPFKIISVSVDILIPTQIYTLGSNKSTFGIYYTPSVEYFGHEHLPYAILALTLLALFVCITTLTLILYPFQLFQKFLSLFPFNWHFLRAFVDSYQSCYKDGTEPGTLDCRWFASVELLIRLILFITYGFTRSETTFAFLAIIFIIYLMLLINFQPFKTQASRYPSTDTVFFLLLSLCCIVLLGRDVIKRETIAYTLITTVLSICFFIVPVAYISLVPRPSRFLVHIKYFAYNVCVRAGRSGDEASIHNRCRRILAGLKGEVYQKGGTVCQGYYKDKVNVINLNTIQYIY